MQTQVPLRIVAGTTVTFRRSFDLYPTSEGWAYQIFLVGPNNLNKAGVVVGSEFEVTLSATETGTLQAGSYRFTERVTKAAEVFEAGSGRIEVRQNLATATAGDYRTHARSVLEAIEAVIAKTATRDQQSYQIHNRALVHYPLADLLKFRQLYQEEVRREQTAEQLAQGLDDGRHIGVRFERP